MLTTPERLEVQHFVEISSILTGFSTFDLHGTGQVQAYYTWVKEREPEALQGLLSALLSLPQEQSAQEQAVRARIMSVPGLGDTARSLIKLWYLGQWDDVHDPSQQTILSAESYTEGLVWKTFGAHPQGAKEQGFGAWALPPDETLF